MATRLYPTARVMDAQLFTPIRGTFGESTIGKRNHGLVNFTFLLTTDKALGGQIGTGGTALASGAGPWTDRDVLLLRAVTKPLAAAAVGGQTIQITLGAAPHFQPGAAPPNTVQWVIYVWSARYNAAINTWDPVEELVAYTVNATAFTDDGTFRFYSLDAPIALGGTAILDGDRLVVEVGQRLNVPHTPPAYGSETTTLRVWHGTLSAGVPQADGVAGGTNVTTRCGWIEFSGTLTEQADPAPPANDACVDALVIPSIMLPYNGPVFHAGMSTDANNAVWWTWTADEDCVVYASSYGGYGYGNGINVYTGGCGALVGIASASETPWVQQSHTLCRWNATLGTQYWIQIVPGSSSLRAGATAFQLWKRQPLQDGDVFIDCQHIVGLRDGQLITGTPTFFGLTPTGNAIDGSLRAMDDFNGGQHTGPRLNVVLFDSQLVEVLDLATLNYGENEVNFYNYAGLAQGQHQASIVFDRQWDMYLGFFGDNFDEIGQLPTDPATGWPLKLDGSPVDPSSAPNVIAIYQVAFEVQASDYVELASDQRTLFYTSAGTQVKRFDVVNNVQLPDFASVPNFPGPRPGLRSGRLLPPGDGSGGLLIANGSGVALLDAAGNIIQIYAPGDSIRALDLDKVEFAPLVNGAVESFWVTDQLATVLYKFDLATGAQLAAYPLYLATGQLSGFSVYNGYRAGTGPAPPVPTSLPGACPIPNPGAEPGGVCLTPLLGGGN